MKKKILISAAVAGLTIAPALTLVTSCSKSKISEVHIININDFHGAAPGYGDTDFMLTNINNPGAIRLAAEFEEIKAKYPGTIVLAGGDLNAGEGFSTCEHADTFYPVLKALDVRYSTVGNHAWEWGSKLLENYHFDRLGRTDNTIGNYFFTSNVLNGDNYREKSWVIDPESYLFEQDYNIWKRQRVEWADPFKLVDLNGHIVCLIGLTTKDTLSDGNMESMKTLSFMDYNAAVTYSKMYCYELIGKEAFNKIDAFILDTHLACQATDTEKPFEGVIGEAAVLAKNLTTRVDGIFAAHSHMICSGTVHNDNFNKDIPIAQGGQAGRRYIDASLVFNDKAKAGKRLQSIKMNVVTPKIDGISDPKNPKIDVAEAQIKKIVDTTTSDRVKEVIKVYNEQKVIALKNLNTVIGKIYPTEIDQGTSGKQYGIPYWYTQGETGFGTNFLQSPTLLEPAGVWANIAMIDSFNRHYEDYITAGYCYPACVAITNLDSLKSGFSTGTVQTEPFDINRKSVYQMHSFENAVHYGCLTPYQLIQYVNYFLDGKGKFNYDNKKKYEGTFYNEPGNELKWDANETTNDLEATHPLGTSYVSGLNQFHGMSFHIKQKQDEVAGVYEVDLSQPFLVYDPNQNNADLYNPSTWVDIREDQHKWTSFNGYIPMVMASFTWQGGNKQNRMLHHWFDFNGAKDELAGHLVFDMYTRATALEYIENLKKEHPTWTINQIGDSSYIDNNYITTKILIKNQ